MNYIGILMYAINNKKYDLNLIVVFELLMEERSVTRAADRACLSQSAMKTKMVVIRRSFHMDMRFVCSWGKR